MKFNVVIVTDHSASMSSLETAAHTDFKSLVKNLVDTETVNVRTNVAHVGIAETRSRNSTRELVTLAQFDEFSRTFVYRTNGSCTPLWDAVQSGIGILESHSDQDTINLVMVVTDGQDNASAVSHGTLDQRIQHLQGTDRWTFLFRVPTGFRSYIQSRLKSVPHENIQEWENTIRGYETATIQTTSALSTFRSSVASGQSTNSTRFFAHLDNVSSAQVKSAMTDISSDVLIFAVAGQAGSQIRDFVNDRLAPFNMKYKTGAAFYQLTKPERAVQSYKIILIRDKTSKAIYAGSAARDLLGVPHVGSIALSPGQHGNYEIFIQSTSVNRKVDANTDLVYWSNFDGSQQVQVKPTPAAQSIAPKPAVGNPVINAIRQNEPVAPVNSVINQARSVVNAPVAPTLIKKPVAKKVARVRNRDTIESRIRKAIHQASDGKTSLKKTLNTTELHSLGIYQTDALKIATQLLSRYNASYTSYSLFFNKVAQLLTVGDMIDLVKQYGAKI